MLTCPERPNLETIPTVDALSFGMSFGMSFSLLFGFLFGLLFGLLFSLHFVDEKIRTIRRPLHGLDHLGRSKPNRERGHHIAARPQRPNGAHLGHLGLQPQLHDLVASRRKLPSGDLGLQSLGFRREQFSALEEGDLADDAHGDVVLVQQRTLSVEVVPGDPFLDVVRTGRVVALLGDLLEDLLGRRLGNVLDRFLGRRLGGILGGLRGGTLGGLLGSLLESLRRGLLSGRRRLSRWWN